MFDKLRKNTKKLALGLFPILMGLMLFVGVSSGVTLDVVSDTVKEVVTDSSGYEPETIAQFIRIEEDGGTIIDPDWLNHVIKTLKAQGIYGDTKFVGDANMGVKKDGLGAVATLYDISGNDNDALQAVGAAQPIWTAAQQNGKAVLVFNGSSHYLDINNKLVSSYPFAYLVGIKDAVFGGLLDQAASSSDTINYTMFVDTRANTVARTFVANYAISSSTVTTGSHILMSDFISSVSRKIWVDGVNEGQNTVSVLFSASTDRTSIGRWGDLTPSNYYEGTMLPVMAFGSTLTTTQREALETMINNYYAIPGM